MTLAVFRKPRLLALLGGLLAGLCSCGDESAARPELLPVERMAFVPKGNTLWRPGVSLESEVDLLVGRQEVTRGQWRAWARRVGAPVPPDPRLGDWPEEQDALPASGMDLADARAFAAAQGMRLPSVLEWAWCAAGPRGLPYPYGSLPRQAAGNTLQVGLQRPTPVGTFPNGRTLATGIDDLFGNVEEWATPAPRGSWMARSSDGNPLGLDAWAMGGSWRDPWRRLYDLGSNPSLLGRELEPSHRAQHLGLRLAVEARDYLGRVGQELSRPALQARMTALGESWGNAAVPLLQDLQAGPEAAPALGWLLEGAQR